MAERKRQAVKDRCIWKPWKGFKMYYIDLDKIDLTRQPPEKEPDRQYYFMANCREYVRKRGEELGRPLTCAIKTFGCQMNFRDSEKLTGVLETIGYQRTDSEKADFVVYNTCTVRENANDRVYGRIGYLGKLKQKNPNMIIALCGCMMQEAHVVEKIKKSYRFVDILFGTHNIFLLAELLYRKLTSNKMVVDIWEGTDQIVEDLPSEFDFKFKAGVNIMYGCNNFCSYCIVPYVRGRERSRKPEEIIKEISRLVDQGVVEIMLLGQNVNSYGKTLDHPINFAELLQKIEKIEGLKRIRFMTSHPKDLSDDLINVMKNSEKICRHLHLPVQSGSTSILSKMNRCYTRESYLSLVKRIREAIPDLSLTTDIIVGFPGETEEDFLGTLDLVKQVGYDSAFTFLYSKRSGTPAAGMEDQVPVEVAKERFSRLLETVQEISAEVIRVNEGKTMEALVEQVNDQDPKLLTGRLSNNLLVHFPGDAKLAGSFVPVHLTECKGFYFKGSQINE